jgi:hypothetical protein
MKKLGLAVLAVGALAVVANAAPVKLAKAKMATITAGGQGHFAPGQFPGGNPAQAGGQSNPTPPK